MSTLEELSDILDAIFRRRVFPIAAEAFTDYWNMSYSRMQVPKQGWPPAILHCLCSVGLLPKEVEEGTEETILKPEFATTVPLPLTPLEVSFTTPPAVLKCEASTMIQSPQRPQKIFGPFPIIPSSPTSPLLRHSSGFSERRTPLSSIQLCKTPPKRRRLAVDREHGKDEKENVVVSVVDRIAALTPGAAKKRRCGEMEDKVEEQKSGPSAKKLRSSMRPRTRSAMKKASQDVSPACSVGSKESEDERQWVEATLKLPFPVMETRTRSATKKASQDVSPACSVGSKESEDERQWVEATLKIPFPVMEAQDEACSGGFSTPVLPQRKRHVRKVFPYVLVPSRKGTTKLTEREHTTSLDGSGVDDNLSSSSRTVDTGKWMTRLRRSLSIPESMLTSKTEKKRKRRESDAGDSDDVSRDYLHELNESYRLPALHIPLPPPPVRRFRKAYTLPSSDSDVSSTSMSESLSSDDDPYIGQVTPHHLISPVLQRRTKVVYSSLTSQTRRTSLGMGFGERYGDSMMLLGSDDSVTTSGSETESPTKARQMRMTTLKS